MRPLGRVLRGIGGLGLCEDERGGSPAGSIGGAFAERGLGAGAGVGGPAEREMGLRLVQGEFGGVEPEPARSFGFASPIEFIHRGGEGFVGVVTAADGREGRQQCPCVELRPGPPGRSGSSPRSASPTAASIRSPGGWSWPAFGSVA